MKIYIASSWKNETAVKYLANILSEEGHEVDAFCDKSKNRFVFHWSELVDKPQDLERFDAVTFLKDDKVQKAFLEDKKWIDWSEVVIMLYPCGNSSHMEAGYAKGSGKRLFIYGDFQKGSFDVMYGFANAVFRIEEINLLKQALKK